jgi:hypothetical protein
VYGMELADLLQYIHPLFHQNDMSVDLSSHSQF